MSVNAITPNLVIKAQTLKVYNQSMKTRNNSKSELLTAIKKGDEKTLSNLYETHRLPFMRWARHQYHFEGEQASEIYQQAFIIMYKNACQGKMDDLKSSIRTYIFGIGKNLMYNSWRDRNRDLANLDDLPEASHELDITYIEKDTQAHRQLWVEDLLNQLSERSRKVLYLYYFANYSMESIANAMGYKSEQVAKKIKYDALQKLKALAKERKIDAPIW